MDKKSRYRNVMLWLGAVCSFIIIILYIVFDINNKKFNVFLNLSYSYLAATIFYIGQIIIPNKIKKEKALKILESNIHGLIDDLNFLEEFALAIFRFEDGKIVIKVPIEDDNIYYNYKKSNISVREYKNYREYFGSFEKILKKRISLLRESDMYSYLPETLIDLVRKVEKENYNMITAISKFYPVCTEFDGVDKLLIKIKMYSQQLSKYCNYNDVIHINVLNEKEIKEYKKRLENYKPIQEQIHKKIQEINKKK